MEAVDSTGTPKAPTSTRRVQTFCDLASVMAAVVQTVVHGAGSFAGLVVVQRADDAERLDNPATHT